MNSKQGISDAFLPVLGTFGPFFMIMSLSFSAIGTQSAQPSLYLLSLPFIGALMTGGAFFIIILKIVKLQKRIEELTKDTVATNENVQSL